MNQHPHSAIENELRKMFPVDSSPYVEYRDVGGKVIGQATRFYFEVSNLVIVFEWLRLDGKFTEKTRVTFANPSIVNTGDVLLLAYGSGNQIAITHLILYKVQARSEYLKAKKQGQPL